MTLSVSVIVASRGRPELLARCLRGLSQLLYPSFEIVLATDGPGRQAAAEWIDRIKLAPVEEANLSKARNAGLALASGEVVAFIDDDAVPEPTWLSHLARPFAMEDVAAAHGFTLGRNGISLQWGAATVDGTGRDRPLDVPRDRVSLVRGAPGRGVKTPGTNMAFRAELLRRIGGFDPAFRFFLEDADVNLQLGGMGAVTAVVPEALVHHGFAASPRRRTDRTPRDLSDIAASRAAFLLRHAPGADLQAERAAFRRQERLRLLRHMQAGSLEPSDVGRLLRSFDAGWAEGMTRPPRPLRPLPEPASAFLPFRPVPPAGEAEVLSGRRLRPLLERARARAATGARPSVFAFSPTALHHRVWFDPAGVWVQRGGVFGRSERNAPLLRLSTIKRRVRDETARVAAARAIPANPA